MSQTKRAYDKFLLYGLLIIARGVVGFISATTIIDPNYLNTTGPVVADTGIFNSVDVDEYYLESVNVTSIFAYPQQTASYIVWENGGTYYAKSGDTGAIDYSGVDESIVVQSAIDALSNTRAGEIVFRSGRHNISSVVSLTNVPYYFKISGEMGAQIDTYGNTLFTTASNLDYLAIENIKLRENTGGAHSLINLGSNQITHFVMSNVVITNINTYVGDVIVLSNVNNSEAWITHCSINFGKRLVYWNGGELFIDNVKFGGNSGAYLELQGSYVKVTSCIFEDVYIFSGANTIQITDNAWSRSKDYTISLSSVLYGNVRGNIIKEMIKDTKAVVYGIRMTGSSSYIEISDNVLRSTDADSRGITEADTANNNNIHDNDVSLVTNANKIVIVGASTTVHNNKGFSTENIGSATILSGTTNITITHGLGYTPTSANTEWTVSYLENPTNDPGSWYITGFNATNAIIHVFRDPGASHLDIAWSARRTP